ncbi:MAG TPA: alpha/beta fold hydrolase [Candidatus Competibacteraceae bacterium]|nr:alpha/beta fold hydrolase [Candidatus Competibacteraceae bacterium]
MIKVLLLLILLLAAGYALGWLLPEPTLRLAMALQRRALGLHTRRLYAAGFDWVYLEGGRGGETVLLVHGFGASKDNWLLFAYRLRRNYRVLIPDLPGFGDSSRDPAAMFDVIAQTERLHAFVETLGLERFHLVGNSMGGHIAALYAAHHPEQVLSLALFANAGIDSPRKSELIAALEASAGRDNRLLLQSPEDFQRFKDFLFVRAPYMPRLLQRGYIHQLLREREYQRRMFQFMINGYVALEPLLPEIKAPTLILWGDSDRVLDVSSVEVMRPLLRHSQVVIMQHCGHVPMLERPAETARHYLAFLAAQRVTDESELPAPG